MIANATRLKTTRSKILAVIRRRRLLRRQNLRQVAGAASTAKLFTRHLRNVAQKKVNVIRREKKQRDAAAISVGAASMDAWCS